MTDTPAVTYEQLTEPGDRRGPIGWITYPRFPDPYPWIPVGPTTANDLMWPVARRRHADGVRWQIGYSFVRHPNTALADAYAADVISRAL